MARLHLTCTLSQERWHLGDPSPARGSQGLSYGLATLRERAEAPAHKPALNLCPEGNAGATFHARGLRGVE